MKHPLTLPCLIVLCIAAGSARLHADDAQPASAARLLAELRQTDPQEPRFGQLVGQLLDHGHADRLGPLLDRQLQRKRSEYLRSLRNQTRALYRKRWTPEAQQAVRKLRRIILATADNPNLSKADIQERSSPAREKLDAYYITDLQEVFADNANLARQRNVLLDLTRYKLQAWQAREDHEQSAPTGPTSPEAFASKLSSEEELVLVLAGPVPGSDRSVLAYNLKQAGKLKPIEDRGILLLNRLRIRLGLGALKIDPRLCQAARGHSQDMAEHNFFSHTSPVPGKTTARDRGRLAGTKLNGENICIAGPDPAESLHAWWISPGHHKIMLAPQLRRVGLGFVENRWTQTFGE